MSFVVKAVKKVFSAVGKIIKKIWKPLVIACAIYFTAGLALSAFPATASFAASLPGFAGGGLWGTGLAVGGHAAVAGTGILSHLAASMGLAGGLAKGALAAGHFGVQAASAGALTANGLGATSAVTAANAAGSGGVSLGGSAGNTALNTVLGTAPGATAATAGSSFAPVVAKAGLTFGEKLQAASLLSTTAGALMKPSARDEQVAKASFVGSFYGVDAAGNGAAGPPAAALPAGAASQNAQAKTGMGSAGTASGVPSVSSSKSVPQDVNRARNLIALATPAAGAAGAGVGAPVAAPAANYQFGVEGQQTQAQGADQFGANSLIPNLQRFT